MCVFTFLASFDFTGKTILPFCTHEGSGLGRSEADIRRLCPGARVGQGAGHSGHRRLPGGGGAGRLGKKGKVI